MSDPRTPLDPEKQADRLIKEAARCRRLAASITGRQAIEAIEKLAAELKEQAARIRATPPRRLNM